MFLQICGYLRFVISLVALPRHSGFLIFTMICY
nr:MAG TPA: hypothetical protein [Caudoviricetes sp.]